MEIQLINNELLSALHRKAAESERLRMNFDLRTSCDDTSQRMLNALEPGTQVPIHRQLDTSETIVCLQGEVTVIFLDEYPNMDAGGPVHQDPDDRNFYEVARVKLSPKEGTYGVQVPKGKWHTVSVSEPSTIFEAKDGAYEK